MVTIDDSLKLDFQDVLIRPKRSEMSSRSNINITRKFKTLHSKQEWEGIPIIAANMDSTGTFTMAEALHKSNMLTCLHKFYSEDKILEFFNTNPAAESTFYTLGVTEKDISKLELILKNLYRNNINKICIDAANGYTDFFVKKVASIRKMLPNAIILAGNVATAEMVQELVLTGLVDIVKIGIGPGSVCETRTVAGVGYPQLSAIFESADAAHGLGALICADGGCKTPGDISKAIAGGADFVMLGGMLAGTDECEGEWIEENGNKSLKFYGMSSREAMDKYYGGMVEYRASEGSCIEVPHIGPVKNIIQQITGGLRSSCSYVGASRLKDLSKCTTFIRVNRIH